jgi:hypothetical protein
VEPGDIAYIALVSKDVGQASSLFGKTLGLKRTDVEAGKGRTIPVFSVGQTAIALFEPGDPCVDGYQKAGVHHIAFNTSHPDDMVANLKRGGIEVLADRSEGLRGNSRLALAPSATAGVKVYYTVPLNLDRSDSRMVERIDHLGIASADNRAAIDIFCNKFGLPLESQQTDVETQPRTSTALFITAGHRRLPGDCGSHLSRPETANLSSCRISIPARTAP